MPYAAAMRAVVLALLLATPLAAATPAPQVLTAAMSAYAAGDLSAAHRDFRRLADQGSAIAETMLGTMSAHGQGVRRDPAAAAAYYLRAAHRGYAPAQLAVARSFARGDGVTVDRAAAWHWLRLARQRGDARVVAAAVAAAAALTASGPTPADDTAGWRPWPSPGD